MPNTITQRTLFGGGSSRMVIRSIHIVSDGSEETDLVIYDNSTFFNDVTKGSLVKIKASGSSCTCRLEWDQTTDAPIISFDPINNPDFNFSSFAGISNPNGSGATGDIVLTTANLDAGDEVTIFIYVKQE